MRKGLICCFSVVCLLLFFQEASAQGSCDHEYQAAIRFIVHAPSDHPFTVNADGDQVLFSHGNLQYCPARDAWRFALRQFDRCGNGKQAVMPEGNEQFATPGYGITTVFWDSAEYKVTCNNLLVSKKYGGWIDLFAWGTSGHGRRAHDMYATFFYPYQLNDQTLDEAYNTYGYGPSFNSERDAGALGNDFDTLSGTNRYFDWGFKNPIREYFGCRYSAKGAFLGAQDSTMYRPGVWRTPTHAEWAYLLSVRKVAGQEPFSLVCLQYGENSTDTVTGVVIYPDDFLWNDVDMGAIEMGAGHFTKIDAEMWSTLEQAGCVFLPGANERLLSSGVPAINEANFGAYSKYWTANAHDASDASSVAFLFKDRNYSVEGTPTHRNSGLPVRLVQDYQPQPTPQRTVTPPPAPKQGIFSISETQKVNISRGNLQYQASTKKWRFAQRQFDRCGNGGDESTVYWNDNGTQRKCDNSQISETYGGWIDLFGWGTSGVGDANPPYFTETDIAQYPYSWSDWGQNTIGTYAPNKWRTLQQDEWSYLIETRQVAGGAGYSFVHLKFGSNPTDTVTGVIIYPDEFTWSDVSISAIGVGKENFTEIDATIWNALEQVGCVFLPGSGYRSKNKILAFYTNGFYWSATAEDKDNAYLMRFFNDDHNINYISYFTYFGFAVRLVRDVNPKPTPTPEPEPEPEPAPPKKEGLFSISETKKVNIAPGNLQYCAAEKKWRFAKRHFDRCGGVRSSKQKDGSFKYYNCPANVYWDSLGHRVPCNNIYVSEKYGGWIDLFSWGTSGVEGANPPYFADYKSSANYSWSDWGQNQIGEYAPNTWRTPTFEDWKYLIQTRKVDGGVGYSYVRIKYGNNTTDTVSGILIYPDDFRFSAVGVSIPVGETREATEIDADTWSVLYDNGCAFLPACSGRTDSSSPLLEHTIDGDYGWGGNYWSSTPESDITAYQMRSQWGRIRFSFSYMYTYWGFSVRLIKDPTPEPEPEPDPAPPKKEGLFSISETKKVNIAPGNLQYCAEQKKWRFAKRHFDRCGSGGDESTVYWNDNGTQRKCDNNQISATYGGWIDLFGWGTGNNPTNTSRFKADYPTFTDWGSNEIYEGTTIHAKDTWRTLTKDEWGYLLIRKINGKGSYSYVRIQYGTNASDTVTGVLILPDDFTWEEAGVTPIPVGKRNHGVAVEVSAVNKTTWEALQNAGCVFLPGCSHRYGKQVYDDAYGDEAHYWSASENDNYAYHADFCFSCPYIIYGNDINKWSGYSVRLVRDVE